jgi:hypothetical protein
LNSRHLWFASFTHAPSRPKIGWRPSRNILGCGKGIVDTALSVASCRGDSTPRCYAHHAQVTNRTTRPSTPPIPFHARDHPDAIRPPARLLQTVRMLWPGQVCRAPHSMPRSSYTGHRYHAQAAYAGPPPPLQSPLRPACRKVFPARSHQVK